MFQSRSRARLIRSGLTVGAVAAALLVAPQAAYAAVGTVTPWNTMPGGGATINDATSPFTTTTPAVQLSTTSCASSKVGTLTATVWNAASVTKNGPTSVSFTLASNGGPPAGATGTAKLYNVCVYDNATGAAQSSGTILVGGQVNANPMNGVTGGGNQITITASPNTAPFSSTTSVSALFTTGPCASNFGSTPAASNLVVNNVFKSNTSVSLTVPPGVTIMNNPGAIQYNICLYDNTGALLAYAPYNVSLIGLNVASGSYLASNGVTATSPNAFLSGVTLPGVLLFANTGCPNTYSTSASNGVTPVAITTAGAVRKLTNNRAAVIIPPLTLSAPNQSTMYQVCFYSNNTNGTLLGSSSYTATVVANPTGVMPAAGPATGDSMITVVGTDFPTTPGSITATLGGAMLTDIQPISDKAFMARTTEHAIEDNVTLVVSTPNGTKALPSAYSFLNPVKVSPNTAPNTAPTVDVDVQGMGFFSIPFGTTGNAGRVFLVNGVYNGAEVATGFRANGPVAECAGVLPISDEELICTLQLNRRLDATGAALFDPVNYTHSVTDISTIAGSRVIDSAGGMFVTNDVGQPITQATASTNIPPNSIITSVLGRTRAVISAPALVTTTSAITATVGKVGANPVPLHTLTTLSTTNNSPTVTITSGAFTSADIGRVIVGTGIPTDATIVAVAPGGASATLSAPASAPGTVTANLYAAAPVPEGVYNLTVVSNGALNAATDDPGYFQTAVTSGSAFTVGAF